MVRLSIEGLGLILEPRDFAGGTHRNARTVDELGTTRIDRCLARQPATEPDSLFDDGSEDDGDE